MDAPVIGAPPCNGDPPVMKVIELTTNIAAPVVFAESEVELFAGVMSAVRLYR